MQVRSCFVVAALPFPSSLIPRKDEFEVSQQHLTYGFSVDSVLAC
jgi:hypothetical protein